MSSHVFYTHGFLSSPSSAKGVYFEKFLKAHGFEPHLFDLYPSKQWFTEQTLQKQVKRLLSWIDAISGFTDYYLMGSSYGGLLSLELTAFLQLNRKNSKVPKAMVLLAPAINFHLAPLDFLTPQGLQRWKSTGEIHFDVPRYGMLPLQYQFYESLLQSRIHEVEIQVPTIIIHGVHDQTIPIEFSRSFALNNKNIELIEVDDDHSLLNSLPVIEKAVLDLFK